MLTFLVAVFFLCVLATIFFFKSHDFRQEKISAPFMQWFKKQLPELTQAEREALNAGGLWWESKLAQGKPNWAGLKNLAPLRLTSEEKAFLENETEELCRLLDDWAIVHESRELPKPIWHFIREKGFLSFIIDKEYGGKGFSAYAHSCIVAKIASRSMSAAVSIMVPNSLGPAEFLLHFGTETQKKYYLPRLAAGQEIPCFGLTAPEAGSDASAITDIGVVCKGLYQGKETLGVRLNFNKRYITLAPIATLMGLAFKLYDPDHLIGKTDSIGITFALFATNTPGVEIGHRHWPSQLAFMNGPIRGQDVFVPLDCMLGGEKYYGKGWEMMMECLAVGRGISLPALATAGAQFTARMTGSYAKLRQQFNRPIGDFEGVGLLLGKMVGFAFLADATRCFTLRAIDQGTRPSIATAITKYHLTEISRQSVLAAMDIHGGRAVQAGPSNYLHLLYNAQPTAITVEGANILTRNLIIFGQGALRSHPFLADEIVAAGENNLEQFDSLLLQHAKYVGKLAGKTLFHGLSFHRLISIKMTSIHKKQIQDLEQMSCAFALATEAAFLVLGKSLKVKEALSARLGDILSHLYMAAAVIAYPQSSEADAGLTEWALAYCLHQIQLAFMGFFANFPNRWLAQLLKRMIFPWGGRFQGPTDHTTLSLAAAIQTDTAFRKNVSSLCYLSKAPEEAMGKIELAWEALMQVMPLIDLIAKAEKESRIPRQSHWSNSILIAYQNNIINSEEKNQLETAHAKIWEAIQVDEFDFKLSEPIRKMQYV